MKCALSFLSTASTEELTTQICLILSPAAFDCGLILDDLYRTGHAGIEIIKVVQCERLKRHRQLRGSKLILPMMAGDHVFDANSQLVIEWLSGAALDRINFIF